MAEAYRPQPRARSPRELSDGDRLANCENQVGTKPGRTAADEITLSKAVRIAIQDVATARLVYQKALFFSACQLTNS
jgi:ornithine cyclodeaminase/alanine dehydrogenase-like protein (mu-crystallin family)